MKKLRFSALLFGVLAAFLAVMAQVEWSIQPPQAYGICLVCHAKDFVNTLLNSFDWYDGNVAAVGKKGLMLTTILVPVGAFIAAVLHKEFKFRFVENKLSAFFLGFAVMVCGLVISGCPMRLMLRLGYGDFGGGLLLLAVIAGVWCGTHILKRRAKTK